MSSSKIDFADTPFLRTSATGARANRLNARCELLLERNRERLEGRRVLDLASHDGRFSYAALHFGARHVTAVEGRAELVAHARTNLESAGYGADRVQLECADLFDFLAGQTPGSFDVVLCFGFFYHTVRQVELLRQLQRLRPEALILDTTVYREPRLVRASRIVEKLVHAAARRLRRVPPMTLRRLTPEYLVFWGEPHGHESATIEPFDVAAVPTRALVELLLRIHGFGYESIDWSGSGISDWSYLDDYRAGRRASWIAAPRGSGRD